MQSKKQSKKQLNAFLISKSLSIFGSALSAIAIPWLLLEKDPTSAMATMVLSFHALAAIATMVLGSLVIDRFNKRLFCMVSDLTLCFGLLIIVGLYLRQMLTPLVMVIFVIASALLESLAHAAENALIPHIAAHSGVSNQRINGLIGVFHNGGDLFGPLLGGLVITTLGLAAALCLDSASFLISFLLFLLFIRIGKHQQSRQFHADLAPEALPQQPLPPQTLTQEPGGIKAELLGGIREIIKNPILRCVTVVSSVINMVLTPFLSLLVLVMIKSSVGSALDAGLLLSSFGVGGFLASVLFTWNKFALRPLPAMMVSVLVLIAAFVALPLVGGYLMLPCLFVIGLCVGYLGPLEQTMVQDRAPQQTLGRVLLAYSACRTLLVPAGYFMIGKMLQLYGLNWAFFSIALLLLAPALCLLYYLPRQLEPAKS